MKNEMFDAMARIILREEQDNYGNIIPSPLKASLQQWSYNEDNIKKLTGLISKKIDIDELASNVAENIKKDFKDNWHGERETESFKKMVLEKLAEKIAKEKMDEIKEDI